MPRDTPARERTRMVWFFSFFFISGFCGILYELVWLRLAMAQFGVTTALVSIVLSTFMAGLGAGSYTAGVLLRRYGNRIGFPPLCLYVLCELLIGISSTAVPMQLLWGNHLLEQLTDRVALPSGAYYLVSGFCLALTLIPWCACMGATIPLAMFAIRSDAPHEARRSFSFLYLANVLGAVGGAVVPLFLIELYGFRGTLRVGAALNLLIASSALSLALIDKHRRTVTSPRETAPSSDTPKQGKGILFLIFMTGLVTMGMELIWIRLFTPYIGPLVYSFSLILVSYLLATFLGSRGYRIWSVRGTTESKLAWVSLAPLGLLPLLMSDARLPLQPVARVFFGIVPFAGVVGFLTPMLVDRWSGGDPDRAGRAYAINILGCIVGPLLSSFVLLPMFGEHVSMLLFVLPWLFIVAPWGDAAGFRVVHRLYAIGLLGVTVAVFSFTKDYETIFPHREVLRDSTATVIATGQGMHKQLLTNGVGMTSLSPITKMMAHLTLASLDHPPQNALVVCFGMGTTFRSVISWGISGTVVELVPSVPKLFTYYHADAGQVLSSPLAHVVIDDGRRYMERSSKTYDAIVIDPPPPVETAGSSLLYSVEFYNLVKEHLASGGIVQQWLPYGDDALQVSVARALKVSFPYVRAYHSVERWGLHFLASMTPIPTRTAAELVARMPGAAITDMMEWGPGKAPNQQFDLVLANEMTLDEIIAFSPGTPALRDDRPINEYYLLRSKSSSLMSKEGFGQEKEDPADTNRK